MSTTHPAPAKPKPKSHYQGKRLNWELALALLSCEEFRNELGLPPIGCPLTQEQIAAVVGCTRQSISTIERTALRKIRNDEIAVALGRSMGLLRRA